MDIQNNQFTLKTEYKINDLITIMEILRSDNGCPWDKQQNHKSIRNNFIEEVYEVADAIDRSDDESLCEELGDTLLQIVFHSQMADESGRFDFDKVADGICKKLILRHPHIFGDVVAETAEKVLDNWDKIKMDEKGQSTYTDTLKSVPLSFPALMRAYKIQKRASKAGFDWQDVYEPLLKVEEEVCELSEAIEEDNKKNIIEEFGDVLFSLVNVSRFIGVDPEEALNLANDKFIRRFEKVEGLANQKGIDFKSSTLEELDELWDTVKSNEKN